MRSRYYFLRVEPALHRPTRPHAGDRRGGVDKNSIHIEQQSLTLNLDHGFEFYLAAILNQQCLSQADAWQDEKGTSLAGRNDSHRRQGGGTTSAVGPGRVKTGRSFPAPVDSDSSAASL